MEYVIKGYEPADALRYFEEISAIPRGSKNEQAVAQYVYDFAKDLGLKARIDTTYWNVVVKKPASPGCEDKPAVMIQGHLDMVCEKNAGTAHDFEKDPLDLYIEDGLLKARGTTLGADNGQAVAYMMALLARNDLVHPPLECVFTSMEEIGLLGALQVDTSDLHSKYMLNVDCGPEGTVFVSCAGGLLQEISKKVRWEKAGGDTVLLQVRGLLGGHSAAMIDHEMGNSIKVMGRILHGIQKQMEVHIVSLSGGSKMNAIPRESDAVITVPAGQGDKAIEIASHIAATAKAELAASDGGLYLQCEKAGVAERQMSLADSRQIIEFIFLVKNGVYTMSMEMPGLVVCSSNLGVATTDDTGVQLTDFIRSSDPTIRDHLDDEIRSLAQLLDIEIAPADPMPGWKYEAESPLRQLFMKLYKEQTGKEMVAVATHGGLECGILKDKMPDLDIIAFGPTADGAHTPDESLDLASFERTWNLILATLKALAEQ